MANKYPNNGGGVSPLFYCTNPPYTGSGPPDGPASNQSDPPMVRVWDPLQACGPPSCGSGSCCAGGGGGGAAAGGGAAGGVGGGFPVMGAG